MRTEDEIIKKIDELKKDLAWYQNTLIESPTMTTKNADSLNNSIIITDAQIIILEWVIIEK